MIYDFGHQNKHTHHIYHPVRETSYEILTVEADLSVVCATAPDV